MENSNQQSQNAPLPIKADDKQLRGFYSNMAQVGHTEEEFILDFLTAFPPHGQLLSRILLNPRHAKRFSEALSTSVKQYEDQFGVIHAGSAPVHKIGFQTE